MVSRIETPIVQIKGSVRDYMDSRFDMKQLKKAEGHIGENIVIIIMKMMSMF